jgi:hypothetical protein
MLRNLSQRTMYLFTFVDKTGTLTAVLPSGGLRDVWVVEAGTLLGYKEKSDEEEDLAEVWQSEAFLSSLTLLEPSREKGLVHLQGELYPLQDAAILAAARDHRAFFDSYSEVTGGRGWLREFDAQGPRLGHALGGAVWPMRPATYVGQVHRVECSHTAVVPAVPPAAAGALGAAAVVIAPLALNVQVISVAPKAFLIEDFMSAAEVTSLLALAGKREGRPGRVVGAGAVDFRLVPPRTSEHGCVRRQDSVLVDALFRRAAEVFGVHEQLLHPYGSAGLSKDFQVRPLAHPSLSALSCC